MKSRRIWVVLEVLGRRVGCLVGGCLLGDVIGEASLVGCDWRYSVLVVFTSQLLGSYLLWSSSVEATAVPLRGAQQWRAWLQSPQRRRVFDRTMARLIRILMKFAMLE